MLQVGLAGRHLEDHDEAGLVNQLQLEHLEDARVADRLQGLLADVAAVLS